MIKGWVSMNNDINIVIKSQGQPDEGEGYSAGQAVRGNAYLDRHWPKIESSLLDGSYEPMPARRKEIDKPDGGVRLLGIPTVLDRLIQQAIAQVLEKLWDHTFSESSFGFRPGRGQRDAIAQCRRHVADGLRFCVDIDLSKFFDRVHHDRLMARLATKVSDKRVLKLIRKYLGFGLTSSRAAPKVKPHWKSVAKLKDRIREITKRTGGRSLEAVIRELNQFLRGWWGYFGVADTHYNLAGLDGWIRRRLRSLVWKQWKNRRTRAGNLMKLGISKTTAVKTGCAQKGAWRMSQVK